MTKEEILFMLDMRPELPQQFTAEERAKYDETVKRLCEELKDKEPFAPMTEVEIVDDFDLKGGQGRWADHIGRRAIVKGNGQWLNGGTGHGGSRDSTTGQELAAKEGRFHNAVGWMLEYWLVFDYKSPRQWGGEEAWWPHAALRAVKNDRSGM